MKSFYKACKEQFQLPDYFGNNLDALWDCITGFIELPVAVSFINITPYHLEKFEKQVTLFLQLTAPYSLNIIKPLFLRLLKHLC